tara:strand:- start:1538 stop:2218 length:681 start_codon:yes stop_codon:yes gene_type:complete
MNTLIDFENNIGTIYMKSTNLLILSILLYISISIITVFVSENITDREVDYATLYDVVHKNTSPYPKQYIPTYFVYFFILYTIVRWGSVDLRILSLFFLSLSAILFMRLFTFTTTQTPPPSVGDSKWRIDHCKRNLLSHLGISFSKYPYVCVDNMFSGHTSHIIVAITIILLYSSYTIERIGLTLLGLLSLIAIITSRLHYTADVIVATIISSLTVFFISKKMKLVL